MAITASYMTCRAFKQRLLHAYTEGEAHAIAMLVFQMLFSLTPTEIYAGRDEEFASDQRLPKILSRLLRHEPVQYILGKCEFCGHIFSVSPDVLIPRPETEELVRIIIDDQRKPLPDPSRGRKQKVSHRGDIEGTSILDCCTGSGCIAIALALATPTAEVYALDISESAIMVAKKNAIQLGAKINFICADILTQDIKDTYDIIVSNPPYITNSERAKMEPNVLDYEPHIALFVPDDDALKFYRAIGKKAFTSLTNGGRLYFEINPLFADDVQFLLQQIGFHNVEIIKDSFGRRRFVKAIKLTTDN